MGGDIVLGLIETHPREYAAALPYCGTVAGRYEEIRYLTDFLAVYDYDTGPLGRPVALPGAGHNLAHPACSYIAIIASVGALFARAQQVVDPEPVDPANPPAGGPAHCYVTASQLTYVWDELRAWTLGGARPADGANITRR